MSEPIFRAFSNKNKEWIDNFLVDMCGNIYIDDSYESGENFHIKKVKATLCRSTGKNIGKKILFQFDIVRWFCRLEENEKVYNYYVCEWSEKYLQFYMRNIININKELHWKDGNCPLAFFGSTDDYEIIGSSLENPELLEKKQNG